jgi:hypothetical protein
LFAVLLLWPDNFFGFYKKSWRKSALFARFGCLIG